jgi:hypothetical protein
VGWCCLWWSKELVFNEQQFNVRQYINKVHKDDNIHNIHNHVGPHWVEEKSVTTPSGVTRRTSSRWIPISDGVVYVSVVEKHDQRQLKETRIELKEVGSDLLIARTFSTVDGRMLRLETTTLLDEHAAMTVSYKYNNNYNIYILIQPLLPIIDTDVFFLLFFGCLCSVRE